MEGRTHLPLRRSRHRHPVLQIVGGRSTYEGLEEDEVRVIITHYINLNILIYRDEHILACTPSKNRNTIESGRNILNILLDILFTVITDGGRGGLVITSSTKLSS